MTKNVGYTPSAPIGSFSNMYTRILYTRIRLEILVADWRNFRTDVIDGVSTLDIL